MGLKDTILSADDIDREMVEVPEWGVTVEMRSMTIAERTYAMKSWSKPREDGEGTEVDQEKFYPMLLAASIFDPETGEKVFDRAEVEKLGEKSSKVVERLAGVAIRLSGMGQGDVDAAGEGS